MFSNKVEYCIMMGDENQSSNMRITYGWNDGYWIVGHTKCHGYKTLEHLIPNILFFYNSLNFPLVVHRLALTAHMTTFAAMEVGSCRSWSRGNMWHKKSIVFVLSWKFRVCIIWRNSWDWEVEACLWYEFKGGWEGLSLLAM